MASHEQENIRYAGPADARDIYRIMMEARSGMEHPERYFTDTPEFIRDVIEKNGYSLIFEVNKEMAGFLNMIRKPDRDIQRLRLLLRGNTDGNCPGPKAADIAGSVSAANCMFADSCAVDAGFRGRGIQYRLFRKAEEIERNRGTSFLLTTVHPENTPSMKNALKAGYEVLLTSDRIYEGHEGQIRNLLFRILD